MSVKTEKWGCGDRKWGQQMLARRNTHLQHCRCVSRKKSPRVAAVGGSARPSNACFLYRINSEPGYACVTIVS